MRTILRVFLGVVVLYVLTTTTAFAESTGFMYLSPDQSYCRAYEIDSDGNLLAFFRANDTAVSITAAKTGAVTATCEAKAHGRDLVHQNETTTFPLDMCSIRHEEKGFETTIVVGSGEVTILETGESSMVCHGVPTRIK